jgi:sugar lactone lactonase YvrE
VTDELDEVRRYVNGIEPPDARIMAEVRGRLSASMAATGTSSVRSGQMHRVRRVRWALALFVVLAVGVALLVPTLGHRTPSHGSGAHLQDRLARLVVDDVNVTVASGSYDMRFNDTTTPATPATPATQCAQGTAGRQEAGGPGQQTTGASVEPCWTENTLPPGISTQSTLSSISGHGTVDTKPYAMVTVSDVGSLGMITLYDNGTNVWEIGGGDYGLSAPGQAGPGAPLSGYAGSVEGTVGQVAGALDMQGLASGTGYLDLEAQEIQGTQPAGTGSVDGVPVTIYKLSESGLQDPDSSGLTPEQSTTIRAADAIIKESGFAGKTTWISVDSEGYIREQKSQYTLPDGSMVTTDTILSNFGCAGTVLMPGQQGSIAPPSGCVSPDHAAAGQPVSPAPGSSPSTSTPTSTTPATTSTTQSAAIVPMRPTALAVGPNGNLYIADQTRNQILERRPDGTFVVVVGSGEAGYAGDGAPAQEAEINRPGGMAFATDGTLFFADEGNHRVRAISPSGTITTVVGTGTASPTSGFVSDGTPALHANVTPNDVAFGPGGHLYISTGEQVLRLNADGTLSVVVGTDSPNQGIYGVGSQATSASADGVEGLVFDSAGNLYFFGFDTKTVFVVQPSGVLTEPFGQQSIYPRGDAGLVTAPDGGVIAMDELSVVRLSPTSDKPIIAFYPGLFHGIRGFSPNGIAVGPDGTIYVDTFYGNGYTNRTAIVSISPNSASSQVLWEAPIGQ